MALNRVAKKWVAALRSGKYKQGKGALHRKNGDKFCCLGVLCNLAVKAGVIAAPKLISDGQFSYEGRAGTLPTKVTTWAKLRSPNGDNRFWNSLDAMNDDGKRFSTIAKFIESEPEGLFKK